MHAGREFELAVVGGVFAGWLSWDAPMRTTTTSSFAGVVIATFRH